MRVMRSAGLCLLVALVGACSSGEAFVDRDYMQKSVKKQKLPGYNGAVVVCYGSDTPRAERDRLAAEACEVYGLQPLLASELRWQCRFTVPHRASYVCYNPDMRMANGALVNPFSPTNVKLWQREQAQIKGRQSQVPQTPPTPYDVQESPETEAE
ncbi:MAG: hypothetical protein HY055_01665 [Magnetospirillum sp.]|nr:hypothetical protein [Magnetospirillum sp.]